MTPLQKTRLGHSKLMSLQRLLSGTYKRLDVDRLCETDLTHSQSRLPFIHSFTYLFTLKAVKKKRLEERNKTCVH